MIPSLRLPEFHFTKRTLANGLDVIVKRQPHLPIVAVNLWYHVGSKNEERRQRGFAHLFEHLMFEGSEHFPGDFFKPLQRLGANINGSTSADRTNYFEDMPAAHAELALAMESDRMGHLIPALSDEKLRIQKDVVKNEYRQNYANRPYGLVWRQLAEALYPPSHPYSWLTIGVMEDLDAATRDDVAAFFLRYYVPSNASLCLVGDIEEEHGLALAERYFGALPGGARPAPLWVQPPELAETLELDYRDRVELERVYQVWHSVPQFHADDAAFGLLADVLARGKSSRLYRKLVVELELAQDVSAYQSGRELAGSFGISTTLRPTRSRQAARGQIESALRSLAEDGVRDDELARVKNGRLSSFIYALDNVGGFGGIADRLNAYNTYLGDPGRITSDFERYQAVTPGDVQRAAQSLVRSKRVVLTVLSQKSAPGTVVLDRSVRPASGPPVRFEAPLAERRLLQCGVPLWVLPRRDLPIVAGTIVLAGGGGRQREGQGGLSQLAAAMLDEGTATRSSQELALAAEEVGTTLSTSSGWDGSYVSFQCLTPHLGQSLALAVDVARHASFPEQEWGRVHGQVLAGLRAERDSAEARAHRGLLEALYPVGHPYRLPLDGSEEDVGRCTLDDVRAFHETFHGPSRAACVVAGDIDPDEIAERLDAELGGWTGPGVDAPELPVPPRAARPRIVLLHRPGAAQAVVRCGHRGIGRLDPDYTDLLVLNQILGGQFTSRLNAKLREEKGFTYGVRSHFDCRRGAGPFTIGASIDTAKVPEALDDIRIELHELLGGRPATLGEVDDAARALIEGQARHFETPSALVSRFASLFIHDLPPDEHSRFAARVAGVTPESAAAAAERQLHPDALISVVVGDASLLAEPLGKLTWADLEVVSG
jgi:predicted Zn-dependent peptidase